MWLFATKVLRYQLCLCIWHIQYCKSGEIPIFLWDFVFFQITKHQCCKSLNRAWSLNLKIKPMLGLVPSFIMQMDTQMLIFSDCLLFTCWIHQSPQVNCFSHNSHLNTFFCLMKSCLNPIYFMKKSRNHTIFQSMIQWTFICMIHMSSFDEKKT